MQKGLLTNQLNNNTMSIYHQILGVPQSEGMIKESLKKAQKSAENCSGINAPNLEIMNTDNVLSMRKDFLLNVAYNGKSSHEDIITVLQYMSQFCSTSDISE